jgi:hypothetical protein
MKKQKKPIILVLVLAALFGGAALMNKPVLSPEEEAKQAAAAQQNKPDTTQAVGGTVADQLKGTSSKPQPKSIKQGRPGMPAKFPGQNGPSIIKPKMAPYKPKPSDSATSTQWYTDESPRK